MAGSRVIANLIFSSEVAHSAVLGLHRTMSEVIEENNHRVINIFLTGKVLSGTRFPGESFFWQLDTKMLRKKGLFNTWRYQKFLRKLVAFLREQHVDIVLCDGITAIRLLADVQKTLAIKSIGIFHGKTRFKKTDVSTLRKHKELWHFVAVSDALKIQLRQSFMFFDNNCLTVIPNAVDFSSLGRQLFLANEARTALGLTEQTFAFGCIGRLVNCKRHAVAISAVAILKEKNCWPEQAVMVIIGDGVLREKLHQQIVELGLQNAVILAGAKLEAARYVSAFDAFVMPSDEGEAFGLALLEGCAAKIPVIVSDIPVFQNITGGIAIYFPVGDAEVLAEKMEQLMLLNEEKRKQAGKVVYDHVRQYFDIDTFKKNYWQMIEKMLSKS